MRSSKDSNAGRRSSGNDDPKIKDPTRDSDDKRQPNPMDEGFVYYEE